MKKDTSHTQTLSLCDHYDVSRQLSAYNMLTLKFDFTSLFLHIFSLVFIIRILKFIRWRNLFQFLNLEGLHSNAYQFCMSFTGSEAMLLGTALAVKMVLHLCKWVDPLTNEVYHGLNCFLIIFKLHG